MGRKAWLFSISPKGEKASAIIYSFVETAKENQLDPLKYLTDEAALDALMPWSNNCHVRKRTTEIA